MSTSLFDVLKRSEILTQEELISFFDVLPENPDKLESFFLENELVTEKSLMGLRVLQQGFGTLNKSNSSRIFTNPERLKHLAHHIYQEKVSTAERAAAEKAAAEKAAAEKAAAEKAAAEKAAAEKAAAEKAAAEKAAAEKAAAEKAAAEKAAAEKAAAEKAAAEKAAAEKAAAEKAAAEKAAAEKAAAEKAAAEKAAAEKAAAEKAAAEKAAAEKAAEKNQPVQRAQNYPDTGDILGKCQLTSVLGSGATSRVFMGFHSFLRKSVAIKVLSPRLASSSSDAETLFLNEAINTARLDHRNLVRVLDADRSQSYTYMIMEYIDGPTLKELLERSGAIKPLNAIRIIQEVLKALKYAYGFSLIHRDIKPGNIMLTRSGEVKLADLGLAKIVDSPDVYQTTSMGTIHGTPYYMPPEQDAEDLDLRGDMYSLGATLYHLVTGELPFSGDSIPQIIYKHLYEAPVPPEEKNSDVGGELSKVILKLMEKKPEDRYQTYDELIDIFDQLEKYYENGYEEPQNAEHLESTLSKEDDSTPAKKKGFFKSIFGI